jgi:tetratricopeptide (TPR) repeat protein
VVLDILAANDWKRPVYFVLNAGQSTYIGLDHFLFVEGLACRVLPVKARINEDETGEVNTDVLYDNLMNKFKWGNINSKKVYLDEQNQRLVLSYRNLFNRLADALIQEGKKDSARKVMDYCMSVFPDEVSHYDYFVIGFAEGYYKTGDAQKADKICEHILQLMEQNMNYLYSFPTAELKSLDNSLRENLMVLQRLGEAVKESKNQALVRNIDACFRKNWDLYTTNVYQH